MSAIAFSSVIGPVPIDCVVSEKHASEIEITEIPIENGSRITDHAFVLPKKISLEIANDNATASFNALVAFQESRVPFTIVTGLFVYSNMLVKSISAERDKVFSQVLRATVDLQEIIIVSTGYTQDPGESGEQSNSANKADSPTSQNTSDSATQDRASGTINRGDAGAQTVPAGQDSSILHQALIK